RGRAGGAAARRRDPRGARRAPRAPARRREPLLRRPRALGPRRLLGDLLAHGRAAPRRALRDARGDAPELRAPRPDPPRGREPGADRAPRLRLPKLPGAPGRRVRGEGLRSGRWEARPGVVSRVPSRSTPLAYGSLRARFARLPSTRASRRAMRVPF